MKEYRFIVDKDDFGKRLDVFLASKMKNGYSRSYIKSLIDERGVLLNNAPVKPHHKLKMQDEIVVNVPEQTQPLISPEDIDLKIIYEDDDILVIDKPSGLVVHPAAGNKTGTLVNALLNYTKDLSNVNPQRPGIVHRLDKETSGVMIVAKNNSSHLNLSKQFASHSVKKKYVAIVRGRLEFDEGIIDLPIGRHKSDFRLSSVRFNDSRYAITKYKVLNRFDDATMLELIPKTGRTHQLRVHLAHLGHSILGDTKYGKMNEPMARLALHSKELELFHPRTNKVIRFSSPLPKEFIDYL